MPRASGSSILIRLFGWNRVSPRLRWPRRSESRRLAHRRARRDGEERESGRKEGSKGRWWMERESKPRVRCQQWAASQRESEQASDLSLSLSLYVMSLSPFSVFALPCLASPRFVSCVSCEPAIVRLPAQAGWHPRLRPCGPHPPAMYAPLLLPGKLQPSIRFSLPPSTAARPHKAWLCHGMAWLSWAGLGGERE